jgi:prokaryotic ubiquitin-like protein Pup
MAEQERKHKRTDGPPSGEGEQGGGTVSEKGKKLKEDMDKLVDEIDDVLEENAEEFVKSYVQRGGE